MHGESWGMAIFNGILMGLALTLIGRIVPMTLHRVNHQQSARTMRPRWRLELSSGIVIGVGFTLFERWPSAHEAILVALVIAFALIGWRRLKRP